MIESDGQSHEVGAGGLVLVPEGAVLSARSTSADVAFGSIRFAASPEVLSALIAGIPPRSDAGRDPAVASAFDEVIEAWSRKGPGRSLIAAGSLAVALGRATDSSRGRHSGSRLTPSGTSRPAAGATRGSPASSSASPPI
ncbi:hypothetical protein [Microbacterium sp. YJN-G]|uniref:hypothetical protein n=1 Tax=Microbacterium sp. YJN-G TaxID=2763257 RepID=UPI0018787683|nr:hypothetical protein [Microbacterium sp. YJN-G]